MIEIKLDYPPSTNQIWRSNKGRVHKSEKYNAWLKKQALILMSQHWKIRGLSYCILDVEIVAHRSDQRRYDIDNIAKPVLDCLTTNGIMIDDEQVHRLTLIKGEIFEDPCVMITIREHAND